MKFYSTLFVFFAIVALSSAAPTPGQENETTQNVQKEATNGGEHVKSQTGDQHPVKQATAGQKATPAGDAADQPSTPDRSEHKSGKKSKLNGNPETELAGAVKSKGLKARYNGLTKWQKIGVKSAVGLASVAALGGVAAGGYGLYHHFHHDDDKEDKVAKKESLSSLKDTESEASIDDDVPTNKSESFEEDDLVDNVKPTRKRSREPVDDLEQLENDMPVRKTTSIGEEESTPKTNQNRIVDDVDATQDTEFDESQ